MTIEKYAPNPQAIMPTFGEMQDMSQTTAADFDIDITAEICPMTYVRTRLALDRLKSGQVLGVTLRGEEALRNVPLSATRQGHAVLSQEPADRDATRLLIRRA
jgi:tRNA 2-thiouridine synthesizing protein A